MTDDRSAFTEARDAGLKQRHEQRLARAQTVLGQLDDSATVQAGRGTVWLRVRAEGDEAIMALAPEAAERLASILTQTKAQVEASA